MKSHELFRQLLLGRNAKELACALNLSTSTIYKWTEPSGEGGSGTLNPLDRIEQIMKLAAADGDTSIPQWICQKAGGYFVKNPESNAGPKETDSVIVASNKIVQEFADMILMIATAAVDNSIVPEEAREIRSRWQELKSTSEEFVNACEQGNFTPIHEHAGEIRK